MTESLNSCVELLLDILQVHDVIFLKGELGAGKTTFAKALIPRLLNKYEISVELTKDDIQSPTFSIVHTYGPQNFRIWHFDLYRLKAQDDLGAIGLYDAIDTGAFTIIEWPELLESQFTFKPIIIYCEALDDITHKYVIEPRNTF